MLAYLFLKMEFIPTNYPTFLSFDFCLHISKRNNALARILSCLEHIGMYLIWSCTLEIDSVSTTGNSLWQGPLVWVFGTLLNIHWDTAAPRNSNCVRSYHRMLGKCEEGLAISHKHWFSDLYEWSHSLAGIFYSCSELDKSNILVKKPHNLLTFVCHWIYI